ncbi:MAG: hypothetical protein RIS47_1543, partial [Bacteroidota bacterium]
ICLSLQLKQEAAKWLSIGTKLRENCWACAAKKLQQQIVVIGGGQHKNCDAEDFSHPCESLLHLPDSS